jgi:hypothetical protein
MRIGRIIVAFVASLVMALAALGAANADNDMTHNSPGMTHNSVNSPGMTHN